MRRTVRLRSLVLLGAAVIAAIVAGAAHLAVGSSLAGRLDGVLPPDRVAAIVEATRGAIWAAAVVALALILPSASWLARRLARQLVALRAAAGRIGIRDDAQGVKRTSRIAEIDALAAALGRVADEQRHRRAPLLRERNELALLVDSVGEGIVQTGPDGRVVRTNRTARLMLGLPAGARGQPVAALIRSAELRDAITAATAGRAVSPFEVTLDDRRILVAAYPLGGGGTTTGDRLGAVAVFVDLTELRRLEDVRRDFVANASHELKTPLTSIRGYSETLLADELPAETRRRFLETIHHNAERLQRIVDDLLDLSRIESGGWRPELGTLDPVAVAEEAWTGMRDRAEPRRIAFGVEADDDAMALADPVALRQVFANLFDNALRYTRTDGRIAVRVAHTEDTQPYVPGGPVRRSRAPSLDISARTASTAAAPGPPVGFTAYGNGESPGTPPGWIVIEVRDTGTGIPGDALPRIFERFYRVDPARSRAEGGTGLGLAIVKHLVEGMGGDVVAESELGKGTAIRFRLPAAQPAVPGSPP